MVILHMANQIGLATAYAREYFHQFVAKRMELGAVVSAAPKENVVRENLNGDVIILLGGKTGRDSVGVRQGSGHLKFKQVRCLLKQLVLSSKRNANRRT